MSAQESERGEGWVIGGEGRASVRTLIKTDCTPWVQVRPMSPHIKPWRPYDGMGARGSCSRSATVMKLFFRTKMPVGALLRKRAVAARMRSEGPGTTE